MSYWLFACAARSPTGSLITIDRSGGNQLDRGVGMAPQASPCIAMVDFARQYYAIAFRGANNNLWTLDPDIHSRDRGLRMAVGTDPAIAAVDFAHRHYACAYQADTGTLFTLDPDAGAFDRRLPMMPGTSPSIATVDFSRRHYAIAFHGANGSLWTLDPDSGALDRGVSMYPGTSPCIATLDFGTRFYAVAFQDAQGFVYTLDPRFRGSHGIPMMKGTNPSMVVPTKGLSYLVAFQGALGFASTLSISIGDSASYRQTTLPMNPKASPSAAGDQDGVNVIVACAPIGALFDLGSNDGRNGYGFQMSLDSNPCICNMNPSFLSGD